MSYFLKSKQNHPHLEISHKNTKEEIFTFRFQQKYFFFASFAAFNSCTCFFRSVILGFLTFPNELVFPVSAYYQSQVHVATQIIHITIVLLFCL